MRGVNKLVVEIKPDGKYFDKALFFLKPEQINAPQQEISAGAERLLRQVTSKRTESRSGFIVPAVIGCAIGAALTAVSLTLSGALVL